MSKSDREATDNMYVALVWTGWRNHAMKNKVAPPCNFRRLPTAIWLLSTNRVALALPTDYQN